MSTKRTFFVLSILCLPLLGWWVLPRKSAGEQLQAVNRHYELICRIHEEAFESAHTKEEQDVAFQQLFPNRRYFSRKYQQIAERFPGSAEAEQALVWLVSRGDDRAAAIDALFAEHSGSPAMAVAAYHMRHRWYSEPETLSRLQQLIDESPHVIVRATSRFALAIVYEEFLAIRSSGGLQNSHLKREVRQQMADVDATDETIDQLLQACLTELEPIAESEFEQRVLRRCQSLQFERSHLQVGTAAPATAGTDLNGEPWRLADNRGQVVLLSFWGDW